MTNVPVDPRGTPMGFWKRLARALESMSESVEGQIEERVSRLEAEVARLSKIQEASSRSGSEYVQDGASAQPLRVAAP